MKCEACNHEINPGEKFCSNCGSPITVPAETYDAYSPYPLNSETGEAMQTPPQTVIGGGITVQSPQEIITENADAFQYPAAAQTDGQKNSKMKSLLIAAVPVIIIVIAVAAVLPLFKEKKNTVKNSISLFLTEDTVAVSGNNNEKFTISGEYSSSLFSLDGSKAAVMTDENYDGGTLWYVTVSEKTKIADEVEYYVIADSGNSIAYLTDYDSSDNTCTLYLYDCVNKKSAKVADGVSYDYGDMVSISPDGKSVSYIADYADYNKFTGYIKTGDNEPEKIGENSACFALSDDGKYIYYMSVDEDVCSVYVKNGSEKTKLVSDIYSSSDFSDFGVFFNNDYSQIIYNINGSSYISVNGGGKSKVASSSIYSFVLPPDAHTSCKFNSDIMVCGVKSFVNTAFLDDDDKLMKINEKYEAVKIESTSGYAEDVFCTDNGMVIFIDDSYSDSLCMIQLKENAEKLTLAEDVYEFTASDDGKLIYYINYDDELWCINGSGEPEKIADDVDMMALSSTGMLFFISDYDSRSGEGTLYYTDNGVKKTKIADDVYDVYATPSSVFYSCNYDMYTYDVYRSNGNESFTKFESGVYDYYDDSIW